MGFLTALSRIVMDMTVVTVILLYLPGLPPNTTFDNYSLRPPPPWTGPLQPNEKLNLVDKFLENQIKGPESFASRDDEFLYAGLITGVIVRIDTSSLTATPVAKIGSPCRVDEQYLESKCGRVLGMTFTKKGKLLITDAVYGLFMIDLDKKTEENRISDRKYDLSVEYTPILTPDTLVNGSRNHVFNSLVLADDDKTVYISVSSTNFPLKDALWEVSSSPSGRILKHNLETGETEVLLSGISFANGIEIDPSGKYLLICETGRARLHKYYLTGEKAGTSEVFIDSLPGIPDNIKLNDNGNYYVGMISPRLPGKPHILEVIGPHYLLRRFIVRLISIVMIPIRFFNSILPNPVTMKFDYWVGNFEPVAHLASPYGLVIEVDGETGEIVSSLHSTNGAVRFISEAYVHDRWIYFGSPYNHYLARIPKRLRTASYQKTSAGVTLGLLNDPQPHEEL